MCFNFITLSTDPKHSDISALMSDFSIAWLTAHWLSDCQERQTWTSGEVCDVFLDLCWCFLSEDLASRTWLPTPWFPGQCFFWLLSASASIHRGVISMKCVTGLWHVLCLNLEAGQSFWEYVFFSSGPGAIPNFTVNVLAGPSTKDLRACHLLDDCQGCPASGVDLSGCVRRTTDHEWNLRKVYQTSLMIK